jgi:hypothetical protein
MEIAQFVHKLQMTLNSLRYLLKLSTWLEVERQISNNQIHLHVRVAPLKIRCTMSNWVSYLYLVFWIAMSCTTATLIRSRIPSQRTFVDTGVYPWQGYGPRYNEDYLELAQVDYEEDAVKPGAQTDAQG